MNMTFPETLRAALQTSENYRRLRENATLAIRSSESGSWLCGWCGDYISFFGPQSVDLHDKHVHADCADRAQRFALKSKIRHRTNPTTGYFPGWRTQ